MSLFDMPAVPQFEPPLEFQSTGLDWSTEVRVALPISYSTQPDARYPVLWVTDSAYFFEVVAQTASTLAMQAQMPEVIVVAVGAPRDLPMDTFLKRRMREFAPMEDWTFTGMLDALPLRYGPGGKVEEFLDLLIDDIRPAIAAKYRTNPAENILLGHSGGGWFTAYTLLTRTTAFNRYIVSSPVANAGEFLLFDKEQEYARDHEDMAVKVFMSVGEREMFEPGIVELDLVGSAVRLARALHVRKYPSLDLHFEFLPGVAHGSAMTVVAQHALSWLWQGYVPDGLLSNLER